jgi:predicted enzyme related to lactoylglutathione lyase
MVNYQVDDLDEMFQALEAAGVETDSKRENSEFGRSAWIVDPEGNRIELWEPPERQSCSAIRCQRGWNIS